MRQKHIIHYLTSVYLLFYYYFKKTFSQISAKHSSYSNSSELGLFIVPWFLVLALFFIIIIQKRYWKQTPLQRQVNVTTMEKQNRQCVHIRKWFQGIIIALYLMSGPVSFHHSLHVNHLLLSAPPGD